MQQQTASRSRRRIAFTAAVALAVVFGYLAPRPLAAQGADAKAPQMLYVAVDGDDKNPGTQDKPFASLARARDAARELKAKGPVTVQIAKGTYYLSETLVLGAEDSGSAEAPVKYVAAEDGTATLSGGRKLDCKWEAHENGIVKTAVPAGLAFSQLFVNGKRQIRARYPNKDAKDNLPTGPGYINMAKKKPAWPAVDFPFDAKTFTQKKWAKPQEAIVHTFPETYIASIHWQIADIDWEAKRVKLGKGGFHLNDIIFGWVCTGIGPKSRFYIENVFEELDAPGEWYHDRTANVLYYKPAEGVDMAAALVEIPILKRLVVLKGTQESPLHHVTLSGFRIAHTEMTLFDEYEAPSNGDWTIHRGGAVFLEGTEDCAVERCFFDAVGGNAFFANEYNFRTRVYGNKFTESADSAICFVGSKIKSIGSNRAYASDGVISNNLVHSCGTYGKQIAGVFLSITTKMTVSHNWMYNLPRAAIEVNDGWGGGNVYEWNKAYDTCLETGDHGTFNSWARERYWCLAMAHGPSCHPFKSKFLKTDAKSDTKIQNVIRNNYFRERHEWTIDLDDGSSNYHLYNNVNVGAGIKLRDGDYRLVENNVMIYPKNPPGFQLACEDNSDVFVRNIIVTVSKPPPSSGIPADVRPSMGCEPGDSYAHVLPPPKSRMAKEVDHNVFWNDIGKFTSYIVPREGAEKLKPGVNRLTMEQWQEMGYDKNSVFADPMFTAGGGGGVEFDGQGSIVKKEGPALAPDLTFAGFPGYQVKEDSPAIKLGFKNFDISEVGLLPDFPEQYLDQE